MFRNETDPAWWRQAVVYQIYPRSFADANGDGLGDLAGIRSRLPYLAALGVDAVWLSPFYPSALADGGYDVDNYRDIDPRIGDLAEFDQLVAALHASGIRLIIDIVPNHSSNRHPWFRAALRARPGAPERERYIFRDGSGSNGSEPPSDWTSIFGGPAWTQVPDGQWYLHQFASEQPDLNWAHPDVRADFLTTLRFWADRGVDGFRVDVANLLTKDLPARLPSQAELFGEGQYPEGQHPISDRDDVHEVYAGWREVMDSYTPPLMAVAEAWVPAHRRVRYASADSLGQAFNFDLMQARWDAAEFRKIISENVELAKVAGSSSTWVFSNHDTVRHATRFGLREGQDGREWLVSGGRRPAEDRAVGIARARAATFLALALPGSAYLYQGEELGLPEVAEIDAADRQDPTFHRSGGAEIGRDGCRVPLPWFNVGPSLGFGPGPAHLSQPSWFADYSVSTQLYQPDSTLRLYRAALAARRRLQGPEELEWLDTPPGVLAFRRPTGWVSVTNFSTEPISAPAGRRVLDSAGGVAEGVPPNTTVWLRQW